MGRMQARAADAAANTPGQHTVSQTLLRRFTVSKPGNDYALLRLDLLRFPVRSYTRGPGGVGKTTDFVPYASTSLEAFWSAIETDFPRAFAAVDDGTLFDPGKEYALSIVRDLVALHFVRCEQVKRNHFESFEITLEANKDFWRRRPDDLARFYRRRTGLIAGPGATERILELLFEGSVARVQSGATLREQMENHYQRARAILETFSVEIWKPESGAGEFLIGDAPAVTSDPHTGFVGLAAGVALLDADVALALPLGPGRMAWLHRGSGSGFREISADEVEKANAFQILAAEANVFARPGTAFEAFAEQVRMHQCYPFPAQQATAST
jgi:hypothetical protein